MAEKDWKDCVKNLKGVVLDMCGVLYDSGEGGGIPIPGSVEAVKRGPGSSDAGSLQRGTLSLKAAVPSRRGTSSTDLRFVTGRFKVSILVSFVLSPRIKASDLQLRFCTNETQATREKFVAKLQRMGFDISVSEVFSPAPAAMAILKERNLRPHLLVHDDAADKFTYQNMNDAFRVLIELEKPVLFSLGRGRYYKETDGLKLDVGVFMKALEVRSCHEALLDCGSCQERAVVFCTLKRPLYACDIEAEVVGKPAPMFFQSALTDMGIQPEQALMIGDDLVNDVGGAQNCGMKALQVRTGKYRAGARRAKMTRTGYFLETQLLPSEADVAQTLPSHRAWSAAASKLASRERAKIVTSKIHQLDMYFRKRRDDYSGSLHRGIRAATLCNPPVN
ncbi:hypothetical protein JZ751_007889 [Albula glossodonta]|uniref:Phospholysine phosphohistidine inorganic pyrophosphate phosphatase n=1 Tax=Albula glossodonta TaxID=121402 RepID=A0A8T2P455_9TELE|nr:hypothetical protein JZ751_007889 [Albula glossodonta]